MLMHTKGILVMTPDSAMVLTGKQSLDFSGGVSAEDNFGIGGYDRVMGPNGQAQYWAPNLAAARDVLMAHYDHTYVAPGRDRRRGGRPPPTRVDRDVSGYPHAVPGSDFTTVGEIFSAEHNPDRKKPFDIRTVMRALSDQDHPVLERWAGHGRRGDRGGAGRAPRRHGRCACSASSPGRCRGAGSRPPTARTPTPRARCSRARRRRPRGRSTRPAATGRWWCWRTCPGSTARRSRCASCSWSTAPRSAGRSSTSDGPIVFCVISRYHGGAFVVFSKALNPNMTVLALEGSFASVLGGAPAAAVVFSGEVNARTATDPRVAEPAGPGRPRPAAPSGPRCTRELAEVQAAVRAEKLGEVAAEFDRVHSIQRAVEVGSVDAIISAAELRPRIIEAIEHGLRR